MDTQVCVLYARKDPMPGLTNPNPNPNQLYKETKTRIENRKLGKLLPDHIRVKMIYAALCGTDLHLMQKHPATGYMVNSSPVTIPDEGRIIGHEGMGIVVDTGANVNFIRKDDYVTFESIVSCKVCSVCRKGNFNQCINSSLLGMEIDGLFGTFVDVPAGISHNISNLKNNLTSAACIEPASVAYVACENTRLSGGDTIVIFGAGPIGAYTAMLAKKVFGASSIHIVEPVKFRRDLAAQWSDEVSTENEFFGNIPGNIDIIIETSGCLNNIRKTFGRCAANARIALLARKGESMVIDNIDYMITNSISIIGSRGHLGGAFEKVIKLQESGRIDLNDIITAEYAGLEKIRHYLEVDQDSVLNNNCKIIFKV